MGSSPFFPVILLVLITGGLGSGAMSILPGFSGCYLPPSYNSDLSQPPAIRFIPGDIQGQMNASIPDTLQGLDQIRDIPESERTPDNTLLRFEEIMTAFDDQTLLFTLVGDEYPDPVITAEARDAGYRRDAFLNEVYLRSDIAHILSASVPADEESNRLKARILDDFQMASLPHDVKDELTRLGIHISELTGQYLSNQRNGTASSNLDLICRITDTRQKMVTLLGFPSFAGYQINQSGIRINMTGLQASLDAISSPLIQQSHEEAQSLLAIKQVKEPDATQVYDYEIASLRMNCSSCLDRTDTDSSPVLYPVEPLVRETNTVISHIFGITITPVPDSRSGIPGMRLYRISDPDTRNVRAWFYLLVRPGEGATVSSGRTYYLRSGRVENGCRTPPVSAIVITVPSRNPDFSPLFSSDALETLFHEYGHMLRHSLSQTRFGTLSSGSREPTGYNEIPSDLLERFARDPEVQGSIYGNIRDIPVFPGDSKGETSKEDPGGLIDRRLYDILLAELDLSLHSGKISPDFIRLYNGWYENLTGFRGTSGGAGLILDPAFFVSGNAGVYWHYVLDDALAEQLFSRFQAEGVLNQSCGISFKKEVFEPAGSADPMVLMGNFLGYPPDLLDQVYQSGNMTGKRITGKPAQYPPAR